ncbi:UNVERIFIED_CONTAM: hypothetical protein Cloal_4311 [Acetivibrio alkalicellulosi]
MLNNKYKVMVGTIMTVIVLTITAIGVMGTFDNKEIEPEGETIEEIIEEDIEQDVEIIEEMIFESSDNEYGLPPAILAIREEEWKESLAQKYGKTIDEIEMLKAQIGDLNAVEWELEREKIQDKMLSDNRVIELIKKGIGISQIEIAEEIAAKADMCTEEVLKMRYGTLIDDNNTISVFSIDEDQKPTERGWEEIKRELGVNEKTPLEQLEVPLNIVTEMGEMGLSEQEMIDISLLAKNHGKSYEEVWSQIKSGKTYDELYQRFVDELRESDNFSLSEEEIIRMVEKDVVEKLKATKEEVTLCKENGIYGFSMYTAKTLSIDYNLPMESIVEEFLRLGNWDKVVDELEGNL